MPSRSRSTLVSVLVIVGLALLAPLGACNNESEGQPCDQGSSDCQSPLVCNPANRCCPPAGQSATTQICGAPQSGVANSNNPPSSSGVVDSGSADTGADAPAKVEASADGPDGSSDAATSDGSDGAPAADGPSE